MATGSTDFCHRIVPLFVSIQMVSSLPPDRAVMKMRFAQTQGDECPSGTSVLQRRFFEGSNVAG
jgi:hypothetical protein